MQAGHNTGQSLPVGATLSYGRYEILGTLGAGGSGVVYRVRDRQLGHDVALKVLRQASGRDLYRFKREFRVLADLQHPNLVELYELQSSNGLWFFTMQMVEGCSLIEWVRPSPTEVRGERTRAQIVEAPLHRDRLRHAMAQLADALVALHGAHKLHRDLKPSNVLVTPVGRVILLDFGLVSEFAENHPERLAVGTPAYMSPEQAADAPLTPASDWYSVGVMFYEALTGRRPFEGGPDEVMRRKQKELPAPPSQWRADIDARCEATALMLLQPDPAARPDGKAMLERLGVQASPATETVLRSHTQNPYLGRRHEREQLLAAIADSTRHGTTVFLSGRAGMGKTGLVRKVVADLGDRAIFLEGRCNEREIVPFKMLDGAIDGLATVLLMFEPAEVAALQSVDVASLLQLFPVLRRVPWFASDAAAPDPDALTDNERATLRTAAFAALRQLLAWLATLRTVVVFLDDVHWGDDDSAAFVVELIAAPLPNLCLILGYRPGEYLGIVRGLQQAAPVAGSDMRELVVDALSPDDARRLARSTGVTDEALPAVLHAAGGNPLLIVELSRVQHELQDELSLEALVATRVARLHRDAQSLLVVVCLAGFPIPLGVAEFAAKLADAQDAVSQLAYERLVVRRRVGGHMTLQPYHDFVRDAVVAALPAEARIGWHEALARALEQIPGRLPSATVMDHWLAANQALRAVPHAMQAARDAQRAHAYRRAAELYGVVIRHGQLEPHDRRELLRRQANALSSAGQLDEAAAAFGDSAALIKDAESSGLERKRVETLLYRGRLEEALPAAEALLRHVGVNLALREAPSLARMATLWVTQRLRGLEYVERPAHAIVAAELERVDVLHALAAGLFYCDPVVGRMVQAEHFRHALDAGEPLRVAQALIQELAYQATAGVKAWPFIEQLVAALRELGTRYATQPLVGAIDVAIGFAAFMCGKWHDAAVFLEAGLGTLRAHDRLMRWEIDMANSHWVSTLIQLGQWREVTRNVPSRLRQAEAREDAIAQFWLRVGPSNFAWLLLGVPAEARANVQVAERMLGTAGATVHHVFALMANLNIDLYLGDVVTAEARLHQAWPMLERMEIFRVQLIRIEFLALRARVGLFMLPISDRLLAITRADVMTLQRASCPWGQAMGLAYHAALRAHQGQRAEAISNLQRAERLFAEHHMQGWQHVAALRRGELVGGPGGAAITEQAAYTLRELGARDVDSLAHCLLPWSRRARG